MVLKFHHRRLSVLGAETQLAGRSIGVESPGNEFYRDLSFWLPWLLFDYKFDDFQVLNLEALNEAIYWEQRNDQSILLTC